MTLQFCLLIWPLCTHMVYSLFFSFPPWWHCGFVCWFDLSARAWFILYLFFIPPMMTLRFCLLIWPLCACMVYSLYFFHSPHDDTAVLFADLTSLRAHGLFFMFISIKSFTPIHAFLSFYTLSSRAERGLTICEHWKKREKQQQKACIYDYTHFWPSQTNACLFKFPCSSVKSKQDFFCLFVQLSRFLFFLFFFFLFVKILGFPFFPGVFAGNLLDCCSFVTCD